ncbi:hypothetical protein B0P06_006123 [Clostridium saccharoperbutylacetonicum]|uniref:Uncharacterized protein n=1 Tax=Clostridium saccharoperbutylacetonicum N1-4(HMT) TaxID=931276 RepID=M1MU26_9CLOT|nr:hypothetical protein [Clostridium saccharoperbutylacetonicum]AGF59603.1 hypothetical protein Cspa_135p00430 [Clostridium saccharoperbutylacetonicum N1-4(HMT)]NRT64540.1 hypothetical protein [Clostridium saccharoperbutylacetonicum]NSB29015.1 hypothetical protein [Clostridium saccharoperbutylacetonicum]NSB46230.1 hypothetical protein [Clostridium saccharoperbutylacetonicum]
MADFKKITKADIEQDVSTRKIADDITRHDIAEFGDNTFLNSVKISFDNNKYVNSMFVNEVKDREYSDFYLSDNMVYNSIESSLKVKDLTKNGVYYSTEKCTDETYKSQLNNFFLVVDEVIPTGCDIIYHIITDDNRNFLIKANDTVPLVLNIPCYSFRLKANLLSNKINTPVINGFAVLYYDDYVQKAYRLINVDLSKDEDNSDTITLVRDRDYEDKLVRVLTDNTKIELTYDDEKDKRLASVETYELQTSLLVEESDMVYLNYTDSSGVTEEVLTKIITNKY